MVLVLIGMESRARSTKQKRLVWSIVEHAGRPLSPSEVHLAALEVLPRVSIATIYRILKSLQEEQRIVSVALPGAPDRYETKVRADHHHHHFHCDGCGRVFDVPGCGLRVDAHVPHGFSIKRHEVVLYGHCNECRA
jgi:Fur family ferric uptake transcriptional regulator